MRQAPTSAAHDTATGDIETNAASFARHLRAGNRQPATIRSYMEAIRQHWARASGCHGHQNGSNAPSLLTPSHSIRSASP